MRHTQFAGSLVRQMFERQDSFRLETMSGLRTCLELCFEQSTQSPWNEKINEKDSAQEVAIETFGRFIKGCKFKDDQYQEVWTTLFCHILKTGLF